MKLRSFMTHIGGRGGTADRLYLSGYNVDKIVANVVKMDAGVAGQVYAMNKMLQFFDPLNNAKHDDVPNLFFGWFPPDTGATAHESITGTVMTISGAGSGINIGNVPGAARYTSSWGSLNAGNQATLGPGGFNWITASEVSALPWTWLGWVFYTGSGTNNIYIESNASITAFITITVSATGSFSINKAGVGGAGYGSPVGLSPVAQWYYLGITYDGTNIRVYINGVLAAGPTAYTHSTILATDRVIIQQGATGQVFTAGIELYSNVAFSTDDIQRHMTWYQSEIIGGSFISTGANIAFNQAVGIIFGNDTVPGFNAATNTITMPLAAINVIQTTGGVYVTQIDAFEHETI